MGKIFSQGIIKFYACRRDGALELDRYFTMLYATQVTGIGTSALLSTSVAVKSSRNKHGHITTKGNCLVPRELAASTWENRVIPTYWEVSKFP